MATYDGVFPIQGRNGQGDRTLRLTVAGTGIEFRFDGYMTTLTHDEMTELANMIDETRIAAQINREGVGL